MPYPFDQIFAADPDNTDLVASNASVLIFAPGDATKAPLALKTIAGIPLANPVPVNDRGFGPAFMADLDQVAWEGGGFSGLLVSYRGLKDEAVAARRAAETAAAAAEAAASGGGGGGASPALIPDPANPGLYILPTGGDQITPDPNNPGLYLIGA